MFCRLFESANRSWTTSAAVVNVLNRFKFTKCQYCTKDDKPADSKGSLIRHNFHEKCEAGLNGQVNCELFASYTYFCMANCLSRPNVALLGFAKFFTDASKEERHHAQKIANFVNMRGGTVMLYDIKTPDSEYHTPEAALEDSISLEKALLKSLEELHKTAKSHNDPVTADFLESYLHDQYKGLQKLEEVLTNVRRAGPGLGTVLMDLSLSRLSDDLHSTNW